MKTLLTVSLTVLVFGYIGSALAGDKGLEVTTTPAPPPPSVITDRHVPSKVPPSVPSTVTDEQYGDDGTGNSESKTAK